MHDREFQEEFGKYKVDSEPTKNSSHKAFVEKLKKQISSDDSSSSAGGDDDVCSEELMKELGSKIGEFFVDIDDCDD